MEDLEDLLLSKWQFTDTTNAMKMKTTLGEPFHSSRNEKVCIRSTFFFTKHVIIFLDFISCTYVYLATNIEDLIFSTVQKIKDEDLKQDFYTFGKVKSITLKKVKML